MGDLDFDAYAERIGYRGTQTPTIDTLEGVCLAHAMRIPFENLDIHLGRHIDLEPAHVFDKLVVRRRGGYCYEQNTLLLEMLRAIGFHARPLAARVVYGEEFPERRPRTHMALLVEIGPKPFLVDVGFGVHNLLGPLPFEPGIEREVYGERFRLREISWDGRALGVPPSFELDATSSAGEWVPLYGVSLDEQRPTDFAIMNWFSSTHPDAFFVKTKVVSRPEVGVRHMLVDRDLEVRRGGKREKQTLADEASYRAALREVFGIELGPDDMLRW